MSTAALIPDFKWAQNHQVVFLTIQLQDVEDMDLRVDANSLHFSGKVSDGSADPRHYSMDFEFSHRIDDKESKIAVRGRGIELVLPKAEQDGEFWGSLMKGHKAWKGHCHVDWARWVDEEDAGEQDWTEGMGDFNPLDFQNALGDYEDDEDESEEQGEEETE